MMPIHLPEAIHAQHLQCFTAIKRARNPANDSAARLRTNAHMHARPNPPSPLPQMHLTVPPNTHQSNRNSRIPEQNCTARSRNACASATQERIQERSRAHLAGCGGGRGRHGEPTRGRDGLRHFSTASDARDSARIRTQASDGN
jgi:hypothetical protein